MLKTKIEMPKFMDGTRPFEQHLVKGVKKQLRSEVDLSGHHIYLVKIGIASLRACRRVKC